MKKMNWKKIGLIINPGKYSWMQTHAQNPFIEKVSDNIYKIHFAARDKNGYSRGSFALIDMRHPNKIESISKTTYLDIGDPGCFDDCGAMPSSIVDCQGDKYLYYTGWSQHVATPFAFYIGLAISKDGGKTYRKYSKAPVFGLSHMEPYMTASPYVIFENGLWKMWYVSCTGWVKDRNNPFAKHYYNIKYAVSTDGVNWNPTGIACIDFRDEEYAIARPIVHKEGDHYTMWYCFRGGSNTYRACYAESSDGISWERMDNLVGIDVSNSGWDSEMICYPCIFEHKKQKYLLYNGNRYGRTGCGLAILK